MPSFTKQVIKNTFISLLAEHPLNEISVKMVVENCGINRKSFYYHYQDIPSLVEEIFREKTDSLIAQYKEIHSVEECLNIAINYLLKNRKYIRHIYSGSSNDSTFDRYLLNTCDYFICSFVSEKSAEFGISNEDKRVIITIYRGEVYGIILDWIMNGMKENIITDLHRVCELRSGMIDEVFQKARDSQNTETKGNNT